MPRTPSLSLRLFRLSFLAHRRVSGFAQTLLKGFWMGVLPRHTLHCLDESYYDTAPKYHDDGYNQSGLSPWEAEMVARYFTPCRTLLVTGAGGGREVLALRRAGFEAWGHEVHPGLAQSASQLLRREGFASEQPMVKVVPRDACPSDGRLYDGIILGWGAYMLIAGRQTRIAFLREVRAQMPAGAPLLLSFFTREGQDRHFRLLALVGNVWRVLLRRPRLDIGDEIAPTFVHFFVRGQLESELRAGGFQLAYYHPRGTQSRDYGHAVAHAS